LLAKFLKWKLSFEFLNKLPKPSIKFFVDYSFEADEDNLGALSPFIIDVDENTTTAIILALLIS
jgi:putative ATP-dependent endonuclease of the OLD family